MEELLKALKAEAEARIKSADALNALQEARVKYLGKKGK